MVPPARGFSIPVGVDGVTYDLDGAPPSGPTSFAYLVDGSVVVADTIAFDRGEPRLLLYDSSGAPVRIIDLRPAEVAAVVDVATDGERLAVLDVWIVQERYRLLVMDQFGEVESIVTIPPGFRFENGLTGLAWDDEGLLLEFELGVRYARLVGDSFVDGAELLVDGRPIALLAGEATDTVVRIGEASFSVDRSTDLGGVQLVGIAPDGSIALVTDEVSFDADGALQVMRRVERYTPSGEVLFSTVLDAADQAVDIARPFELTSDGTIAYLHATPDSLNVVILDEM